MGYSLGAAYVEIKAKADSLKGGLDSAKRDFQGATSDMQKSIASINWAAVTAAAVGFGTAAAYGIKKTVDAASDLSESQNKVNVVFGSAAKTINDWAGGSVDAFGLSKRAALDAAGAMGNMWTQLGATSDSAAENSMSMTKLAADLASFHNAAGGAEEVLGTMQSAFRGEYDALQRYIPTINAAAVEHQALAMTGKTAAKELTALEKATAAQAIILRDAGAAVGDFARTSDAYANSTRMLQARVEDLTAGLGQIFLRRLKTSWPC